MPRTNRLSKIIIKSKSPKSPKSSKSSKSKNSKSQSSKSPIDVDIDDQNRAYYESLEKDMEKDIAEQIAEIDRQTKLKELQEESERQKEIELKLEELAKIEKEKNQPSPEELRQRRLKFYEK
jgi:hypothetical protein